MQTILFFLLNFIQISNCASDQPMLGSITVQNKRIPAYVSGKKTYSGKIREGAIIESAEFHQNYIIERQLFFGITYTPLICYSKSDGRSEAFIPPIHHSPIQTIMINNQDKNFKNFIINHEMIHLYLRYTYETKTFNFKEIFYFNCKLSFLSLGGLFLCTKIYPIIPHDRPGYRLALTLVALFLLEFSVIGAIACPFDLFLSHRQNYYNRIEEFLCDAKGITYGTKKEQLNTIQEGIVFFQKPEQFPLKMNFLLFLFGHSHPLHKDRIEQLKKIKRLIKADKAAELKAHLDAQEQILKNYYESFLTNPKKWFSTRYQRLKGVIKEWINFFKDKDRFIVTPYDTV